MAVITLALAQHVDPALGPLKPFGGPDNADEIPHEAADLAPDLLDHDLFVAVGDPAFVPGANLGYVGQIGEVGDDVPGSRFAEHQAFEKAVRGETVGSVKARLGHFSGRVKARRIRAPVRVHYDSAARVMLRGNDRDRLLGDVDAEAQQLLVDVGEVAADEFLIAVRDIEVDVI